MNINNSTKFQLFGIGAATSFVGSSVSSLSNKFLHTPIGFFPMSFKNFVKVSLVSGGSTILVMKTFKKVEEEISDKILDIVKSIINYLIQK